MHREVFWTFKDFKWGHIPEARHWQTFHILVIALRVCRDSVYTFLQGASVLARRSLSVLLQGLFSQA